MPRSAAVLCQDKTTLHTLKTVLDKLGIDAAICHSQQEAMEQILATHCTALIVDFDLPGAAEIAKLPQLLDPQHKPALLAMTATWPGTGEASQSGANRILYRPLQAAQIVDAFETSRKTGKRNGRKAQRHSITSVVWLELECGTLPAIATDLSEYGMAIRTTRPLRPQLNLSFRCTLPGTGDRLQGQAEVIWADGGGRAGMFFSRLSPTARRYLKCWLGKQGRNGRPTSNTRRSGKVWSLLHGAYSDMGSAGMK